MEIIVNPMSIDLLTCDELGCNVYCGMDCPLYFPCVTCACQWYNMCGVIMKAE